MRNTILFTWECGGGMGHLVQIRPRAEALVRRGHRVWLAAKDVARAAGLFEGSGVRLLAAPFKLDRPVEGPAVPCSFAHVLHNVGWDTAAGLGGLVDAWRAMYELIEPDVTVFEHSPTAMLAARGFAARQVNMGTGFTCPPDQSPLPNLRPWETVDPVQLAADEAAVLDRANQVLAGRGWPRLDRIGQLFSEVDQTLLTTFRELDHYPDRGGNPHYYGCPMDLPGSMPQWPEGSGKRIFAYLKPFAALPHLLVKLKGMGCPTIVVTDGIDPAIARQFAFRTMRFESGRLDQRAVAHTCDAAIINATHGTAASMLLAGKPMLLLPIYLEHQILGLRVVKLGAGVQTPLDRPAEIVAGLEQLAGDSTLAAAASAFAERYRGFNPTGETEEMVGRIERRP